MRVLVTSAASATGQLLVRGLSPEHEVRSTDLVARAPGGAVGCDLEDDEATEDLVRDLEAIVHVGYEGQEGDASALVDYYTRRTYNLLHAASEAGVARLVYVSTLRLLESYEENLTVTERWRPRPAAHDLPLLACHLGEITAKEYARDRRLEVVGLRLGFPLAEQGTEPHGSAAVSAEDALHAVDRALTVEVDAWLPVHVQSPGPRARYLTGTAAQLGLLRGEKAS